jgi:broad specificity phosphatase PhoE
MAEAHEKSEVQQNMEALRACAAGVMATMKNRVKCTKAPEGCVEAAAGTKLCHFIRHGEGFHNVAQREWRSKPDWDGASEPYTLDTDPSLSFADAELNEKGKGQAVELQQKTEPHLKPQLLVVSPMRRATLTGLLAFEPHVKRGELPVLAVETCHERAGRHTCDKRLSKAELAALFPAVDYSMISSEDDPFWGDGVTREPWEALATRAGEFIDFVMARPESHLAVAAHSAILLSIFNAVCARTRCCCARRGVRGPVCGVCVASLRRFHVERLCMHVAPRRSGVRRREHAHVVWHRRDAQCAPHRRLTTAP